jgi:hypothetical protein
VDSDLRLPPSTSSLRFRRGTVGQFGLPLSSSAQTRARRGPATVSRIVARGAMAKSNRSVLDSPKMSTDRLARRPPSESGVRSQESGVGSCCMVSNFTDDAVGHMFAAHLTTARSNQRIRLHQNVNRLVDTPAAPPLRGEEIQAARHVGCRQAERKRTARARIASMGQPIEVRASSRCFAITRLTPTTETVRKSEASSIQPKCQPIGWRRRHSCTPISSRHSGTISRTKIAAKSEMSTDRLARHSRR